MILTKIYSNLDAKFTPITFRTGLNIILGEITNPENLNKDTHNLGKSKLAELIDYCLLRGRSQEFFLFKHLDKFEEFVFFLEIEYQKEKFITIKRSVRDNSKISIFKHMDKYQNHTSLDEQKWTHSNLPIKRAKQTLDSFFNLEVIKPWDYRMPVSYALRSQSDYKDVFQLSKFVHHITWKPYVAQLLGLNSDLVKKQYELKIDLDKESKTLKRLEGELAGFTESLDKLEGLILLKEEDTGKIKKQLDTFNFNLAESNVNKDLVSNIDTKLAELNKQRYYISCNIENLETSLNKHSISFNPDEAKELFSEAGLLFDGQIKKTYDELIQFNKEITAERKNYLKKELAESKEDLKNINKEIESENSNRSKALAFLKDSGSIEKYKILSNKLIQLEAEILALKSKEVRLIEYNETKAKVTDIKSKIDTNKSLIEQNVKSTKRKDSKYSQIRLHFNSIIKEILDKEALISIDQNGEGNLEFKDEILDSRGQGTSESSGNTYKKLLCIAFDIAINQIYATEKYSHFIYHDGFLETLDNRKKQKFIELLRKITNNKFQYIGTLIDSEIPSDDPDFFSDEEVILTLHDGPNGTLFKGISF